MIDTNIVPSRQKPVRRLIHLWKKANTTKMAEDLDSDLAHLDGSTHDTPINDLWITFKTVCLNTIRKHVPTKWTSSRFNQPWCNRKIKQLSRQKRRAYNTYKRSGKDKDRQRYRPLQKSTQHECKSAYNSYVSDMVQEDSNSKKLYSFIKSKKCDSAGIAPLLSDGNLHGDPETIASLLNQQFSSVFTTEDTSDIPPLGTSSTPSAPDIRITEAHPLTKVKHLRTGKLPVNVSPIFKKGDKSKPANYRPVSLTSMCCKVIEHIIHSHLMNFFEHHSILTDYQHGFRKKRSCESQLITTIQDLALSIENNTQVDAVLLDFSKVFDKVPHERLLAKLDHYGVRGNLLNWIRSFLSGRTQKVLVEGHFSPTALVTSGVPQGTVLGPLLLAYINDLPSRVRPKARLFADDCLLYRTITTEADARLHQMDLDNLQDWEIDWIMHFNPDKCEVIRITTKRKQRITPYYIHGKELATTTKAKYLGVNISNNLSWNHHIDSVCKKANNTTAFLRRNLSSCPSNIKDKCYKTLVRPQVEYASTVWDPHTKKNIDKLEAVQRRAARFVTNNYNTTSSVTTMIDRLEWESLQQRRIKAKAIMMYRVIHSLVAIDLPPQFSQTGAATRGHQQRYRIPFCRTNVYKESFFPTTIRIWNQLPEDTITAISLESFKTRIQGYKAP
ncbi:uncharacterized protein LOC134240892 [Saccostrea cucullata]|uniref:uncharacterized protein LOC134240892 n=1 Tax=Saccostrea cuccullata TaxID=36930 RepID=UPI002ECFCFAD